jgi:predicted nucleic acid-binding protein
VIIADTNLVAYLIIEGEHTESARHVWERDPDWRIPPLWRSEFLNVLATTVRAGVINEEQALVAWRNAQSLLGRAEREPGGENVLRTALKLGISAYDAQFVVLAEELRSTLVTGDRKLRQACPGIALSIAEFADLSVL